MEIKAGNRKLLLPYDDDLSYWSQVKHRTAAFLLRQGVNLHTHDA